MIHYVFKKNYVDARNEHDSVTKLKIMMKQRFAILHFKIKPFSLKFLETNWLS